MSLERDRLRDHSHAKYEYYKVVLQKVGNAFHLRRLRDESFNWIRCVRFLTVRRENSPQLVEVLHAVDRIGQQK